MREFLNDFISTCRLSARFAVAVALGAITAAALLASVSAVYAGVGTDGLVDTEGNEVVTRGAYQSPAAPGISVPPLRLAPPARGRVTGSPSKEPLGITPGYEVDPRPPVPQDGDELFNRWRGPDVQAEETLAETPPQFSNPNVIDGIGPGTGASPPDTVGDVGPNHYVQSVNGGGAADTRIQVFNKDGTNATGVLQTNTTIWSGTTGCSGTYALTDPIALYDEMADRWMFGEFARDIPAGIFPNDEGWALCIAVSQTADPAGAWYAYEYPLGFLPDYVKFGVWPDGYYMSSQRGFPDGGIDVWVFDRANMVNGNPATFQRIYRVEKSLIFLPSDLDGPPPPPLSPNYFVRQVDGDIYGGSDRVDICAFDTDWGDSSATTFTCSSVSVAGFDVNLCGGDEELGEECIPQPNTTQQLDSLAAWPMFRNQYRNFTTYEMMTFNHTVDVDGNGHAGVRWYELSRTGGAWSLWQQGTFSPDQDNDGLDNDPHRWMASIAMDRFGNMALGYSVSDDDSTFPGIRYAGRTVDNPLGLMPHGEVVVQAGSNFQGGERWGDYSSMNVDPVDGCTFWFTTEFINAGGNWDTRIANFSFADCAADLEIEKSASPDPALAGEQLFYTITVTNNGPIDASDVEVVDTLPLGVNYVTDTDTCVEAPAGTLTCDLGDIANGDSVTFTIKVIVDANLVANAGGPTTITNTAVVSYDNDRPDIDDTNNEVSLTTIVEELADLEVTKVCKPDKSLQAGEIGECTIFVDNLGPSYARNVQLTDTNLSDGVFTIDSVTSSQGSCSESDGVVTCDLGDLPAAPPLELSRATVVIEITADEAMDINDVADAVSDTPDPDLTNNQAEGSISVTAVADLELTKSDSPDPVVAGTTLTYTLQVSNNGPSTAVNVLVEDIVPAGVSIDSVSATGGGDCNAGVPGDSTQPTTCAFDSLAASDPAETMTIVVTVLPQTTGILHNDAGVSSDTFDPDNLNDLVTEDTTVEAQADLVVTKSDHPDPVLAGENLTYDITITNYGPSTAVDVMLTDALPDEVSFVGYNISNGSGTCEPLDGSTNVECNLNDLDPSEFVTVFIQVLVDPSVPDGTTISDTATVSSAATDPVPGNNSITEDTLVNAEADMVITKDANFLSDNPSKRIVYTLDVTNTGPSDALDVVVVDELPLTPKKIVYVMDSGNGACAYDKGTHDVTCNFGTLFAGEMVTVDIIVDAKGSVRRITNVANVLTSTTDPDPSNNTAIKEIRVKGGPGKK